MKRTDKIRRELRKGLRKAFGWAAPEPEQNRDFSDRTKALIARVRPYTMTSNARIHAIERAVDHVVRANVAGDFVECGVWRGGSAMAAATLLKDAGETSRRLWLYDTYAGMPKPRDEDVSWEGVPAIGRWSRESADGRDDGSNWLQVDIEDVRRNLESTGFPADNITLIKGLVQDTVPKNTVEKIAILRLDTDFYESTKVELEWFWPKLTQGGFLIIDDYGRWLGQRQAVDEFFASLDHPYFLARIDEYGYMAQKTAA